MRTLDELNTLLEEGVERTQRQLYTFVPARLVEINDRGRGVVEHKFYQNVSADDVPMLTQYIGDNYGEKHAYHLPEEGHMLCPNYPLDAEEQAGRSTDASQRRHHSFQDGYFIGTRLLPGEQSIFEEKAPGDYFYRHKSGTSQIIWENGDLSFDHVNDHSINMMNDTVQASHYTGNRLNIDSETVELQYNTGFGNDPDHALEITNAALILTFSRLDGTGTNIELDANTASMSVPDDKNSQVPTAEARVGVSSDGHADVDGLARVGDQDAYREDRTTLNSDATDPRTYAETTEPVEPIHDPTNDAETTYDNPSTTETQGAVDFGLFESRRHIVERREVDPDVTITDPTNPAYVDVPQSFRDAGTLPVGYLWFNTTDDQLKIQKKAGVTVVV